MRLTDDQFRQGLLHPNDGVRRLALEHFAESSTTDPAVTATALEAIAKYGPHDFLVHAPGIADLPQTAESVRWAVESLAARPVDRPSDHYANGRSELVHVLLKCPFDLFAPHEATVLGFTLADQERSQLGLRRTVAELTDDALWDRLDRLADVMTGLPEPWQSPERNEAEVLLRAAGARPTLAGRVLERVNSLADTDFHFRDSFAVRLAGHLRLAEALPPLVELMTEGDEGWHDDLQPALSRIGSDECVRLFRGQWAAADWSYQFTAACVMGNIHTDASVAACLELAAAEPDPYSRDVAVFRLLESAVRNCDPAAVEPTRQFLLNAPHTRESLFSYERDLRGSLIDACTLTGERFPEYDRWRREEIEAMAAARRRMAKLDSIPPLDTLPPVKPESPRDTLVGKPTAGRNDPCPCKSGKKFKKCCGK